jgi:hypothetical protein
MINPQSFRTRATARDPESRRKRRIRFWIPGSRAESAHPGMTIAAGVR